MSAAMSAPFLLWRYFGATITALSIYDRSTFFNARLISRFAGNHIQPYTKFVMRSAIALLSLWVGRSAGGTMSEVRAVGDCEAPFDDCVDIVDVDVPSEKPRFALIKVNASSVNPSDVDQVEGGQCSSGCGVDLAGTVVSCPGCASLQVGDEVWGVGIKSYAEYVLAPEIGLGLRPQSISFVEAGSIPQVGLTSYLCLKRTGASTPPGTPLASGNPWTKLNITVVVTAGSGGTGFIGIELAKAWGATNIITASTGDGIAFCYSLGATLVIDYKEQDIFDAIPDDSVDYVYDNYGEEGTADIAMRTIRSGGVYLLLPHGECFSSKSQAPPCLSGSPKEGVSQFNYFTWPDYYTYSAMGLDEMAGMFDAGVLTPRIDSVYLMSDIAAAFNRSAGNGAGGTSSHYGKIAVAM